MAEAKDNLDSYLEDVGVGRWAALSFATSSLVTAIIPPNIVGGEFLNPSPSFWCLTDRDNNTSSMNKAACTFWDEEEQKTTACSRFLYDTSVFHSTVAMEWDLVCDRTSLHTLFQVLYTTGSIIGGALGGALANRYGRRWAVRLGALMTFFLSVVLTISPWLYLVFATRILLGVFNTLMLCPSFLLSMEVCVPRHRPIVGMMIYLPYGLVLILFSVTAFFVRRWRILQAISIAPALLILPILPFVDESPRWLLGRGRVDEAAKVLRRGARLNGKTLPDRLDDALDKLYQEQKERTLRVLKTRKDGLLSLVMMPTMRKRTLVLISVWFLVGVVYLGILLEADQAGSPFLYMGLLGVAELPSYTLVAPITRSFGRRPVGLFSLAGCGLCVFARFFLHVADVLHGESWINWVSTMTGYMLICIVYQVNYLYAPELFPTTVRSLGTAICILTAYVSFNLPPFISVLLGEEYRFILHAIFGICCVVAGLLLLLLPETNGRRLPETVAEVEEGDGMTEMT